MRSKRRLDPALFFRASRQHIVNLRFIESVETSPDDTYIIHLKNKSEVPVSRRQSRQLRESLGLVKPFHVSSSATDLKTISPAYCWMIESRPV